jgi:hypothetical protein
VALYFEIMVSMNYLLNCFFYAFISSMIHTSIFHRLPYKFYFGGCSSDSCLLLLLSSILFRVTVSVR